MTENNDRKPIFKKESPFGPGLHAAKLKKMDVVVFSKMYGRTDAEAATDLISLGFNGQEIIDQRGWSWSGEKRKSRTKAAREVFVEYFGEPIPEHEQKTILRKAKRRARR